MQQMLDFNIKLFLENSAFYPASGVDVSHLKSLSQQGIENFIHVDYSMSKEEVQLALSTNCMALGYQLIKISEVTKSQITPNGFRPIASIPFNEHERDRLSSEAFIRDRFNGVNFTPFALLAEYELEGDDNSSKFSILHIGGEACATFEATYLTNGINPKAVVIIRPSEGYGDNWTLFTNSDFRLQQMLKLNVHNNNQAIPKYLILAGNSDEENPNACWKDYKFKEKYINTDDDCVDLFINQ